MCLQCWAGIGCHLTVQTVLDFDTSNATSVTSDQLWTFLLARVNRRWLILYRLCSGNLISRTKRKVRQNRLSTKRVNRMQFNFTNYFEKFCYWLWLRKDPHSFKGLTRHNCEIWCTGKWWNLMISSSVDSIKKRAKACWCIGIELRIDTSAGGQDVTVYRAALTFGALHKL